MKLNIKEIRIAKDMNIKELADKAGYSVSWVRHIENGTKEPSLKALARLADVLGVSIKDFF
jgi:transcriptional regulator with XRE-family HTH domain